MAVHKSNSWFVGGKTVTLQSDGSGVIDDAYMTTSENERNEWSVEAKKVILTPEGSVKASNVFFKFVRMPIFWAPKLTTNLKESSGSQFKYRFEYRHNHGATAGVAYKFYESDRWMSRVLLDVGLTKGYPPHGFRPHGMGGGFEAHYKNPENKEAFSTFNYWARSIKVENEDVNRSTRFRFQGRYTNRFFDDKVAFKATYDRLSDQKCLVILLSEGWTQEEQAAHKPHFLKEENWISNLNTCVRLNKFQTVKQELPLFQFNVRPMTLGSTKWILNNRFNAGYLNYKYGAQTPKNIHDFHSSRIELDQKLFRNFQVAKLFITPSVGYRAISYSNSPQHNAKLLAVAKTGVECHTRLIRHFGQTKHAIEPYVNYEYITAPSVEPNNIIYLI